MALTGWRGFYLFGYGKFIEFFLDILAAIVKTIYRERNTNTGTTLTFN